MGFGHTSLNLCCEGILKKNGFSHELNLTLWVISIEKNCNRPRNSKSATNCKWMNTPCYIHILGPYPPPSPYILGEGGEYPAGGGNTLLLEVSDHLGEGGWVPPLWTELLTDARENITFPQLRCRAVIIGSAFMRHHFRINNNVT